MNMNTDNTNCPRCGAEPLSRNIAGEFAEWKCGYWNHPDVRPELCREREDRQKADNEVASLREQNQKLREIAEFAVDAHQHSGMRYKLKTELARLAPATEEPVFIPTDLNQQNKENTLDLNEWRALGEDEVIQEGDERIQHHRNGFAWIKCKNSIGTLAGAWPTLKFRTRRPLPKQEEKAPNDLHAWMRLQESINKEVAVELQKLRDEIQKLKQK